VLVGGVALVCGCTGRHAAPVADPDAPALEAARRGERSLLADYAEGSDAYTVHLAHLRALGGQAPTPAATGSPARGVPSGPAPERATVQPLLDAARNAQRGRTAAVLASIAASHAVLGGVTVP
jgi:hypothetical protein